MLMTFSTIDNMSEPKESTRRLVPMSEEEEDLLQKMDDHVV